MRVYYVPTSGDVSHAFESLADARAYARFKMTKRSGSGMIFGTTREDFLGGLGYARLPQSACRLHYADPDRESETTYPR